MPATIPRFAVRDQARTCWTCEHAQQTGIAWGDDPNVPPFYNTRDIRCCQKAVTVAGYTDPFMTDKYPQRYGYWIANINGQPVTNNLILDGSKNWCSQWRQSSLPIPALPPGTV